MAIAQDSTSVGTGTSGTVVTSSHTIVGSDRLGMFICTGVRDTGGGSSRSVSALTVNAVDATFVKRANRGDHTVEVWYIVAPTTGTISATWDSESDVLHVFAIAYTDIKQTAQPDANAGGGAFINPSGSPLNIAITTVAANTVICSYVLSDSINDLIPQTGFTEKDDTTVNSDSRFETSIQIVSVGTGYTAGCSSVGFGAACGAVVSLTEGLAAAGGVAVIPRMALMGVG